MATTLTDYLRLRITSDLTKDAIYNLERLDTLGATFLISTTEDVNLRSREQISLQPRSPDLGGIGVGGLVTIEGSLTINENITAVGPVQLDELRLLADINTPTSFYSAIRANPSLTNSTTWTLPLADGTASQVLTTDGAGQFSWSSVPTDSLLEFNVKIGNGSNIATATDTSALGDIASSTSTGLTIKASAINNSHIDANATINRSKLANGNPAAVLINDISGVMTDEAQLAIVRGGTAAASVPDARINLGLEIGVDVQSHDADLDNIAGLPKSDNDIMISSGGSWVVANPTTYFGILGLGTISTQDSDSVSVTGGAIDGTTIGTTTPSTIRATTYITTSGSLDVAGASALAIGASAGANDITVGGASSTLVVPGNLEVQGTTTTIDTATLDVADANITVNDGGTDGSAEGAGLTVERTGTDGSLVYEDALASKWKIGSTGSESEIVDVDSVQTLINKTIPGNQKYVADWTTSTSFNAIHNIGSKDVLVEVYDIDSGDTVLLDRVTRTSTTEIDLTASTAPTGSGRRVLIRE
jgi:hypothetical protein